MLQEKAAGEIQYAAGKTRTLDLDVGEFNSRIFIEVKGTFSNAGEAPAGPNSFARILGLIASSRIILDDKEDFLRLSGLDMAAICGNDNGFLPSGFTPLPMAAGEYRAAFPLEYWGQNTSTPHLSGLDLRNIKKAQFELSFGSIADIYDDAGGMTIDDLTFRFIQESDDMYGLYFKHWSAKDGKMIGINPAMRDVKRSDIKFDQPQTAVEIGRIVAGSSMMCQGALIYTHDGQDLNDLIEGDITFKQGTRTWSASPKEVKRMRMEILNRGHSMDALHYQPWSPLLDHRDDAYLKPWKDDMIITANLKAACTVTVLAIGYRQER